MRETLRGALLSTLSLLAAPLAAQSAESDATLSELRRSVIAAAEDAYTHGDDKTLRRMESAPSEQTMAEIAEKLFLDVGEEMSRIDDSGLATVASASSWWRCLREYMSNIHACWMAYNNCMQPRGDAPPKEEWCKVLLDACMDNAAQRYDMCMDGPPPI